jgi:hypothetical protein
MPSVKLHVSKFETLIARRGRDVEWRQAILCSCWNMDSGQPNYHCQACRGKGYTYEDPVQERGLVMSITQNKDFDESAGVFDIGDAVMTVPKRVFKVVQHPLNTSGVETLLYDHDNYMFDIGMYDLVTLLDDEVKTSELLIRGTPIYTRPADELLNERVTKIITVRTHNPFTGEIVKYTEGTDFTLAENVIEWIGNAPDEGQTYSVTYKHRPVYTVSATLPKPRHQDEQDLPRYVALKYRAGGVDVK